MQTDERDKRILNILLANSRLSYRQIAKKAGFSAATAMKRVKALEKCGVIKEYTANLDYEQLDLDIHALIELRISKGKLHEVEQKIAKHPNVYAVYDKTGPFDATIIARFRTRKNLDDFLKKIQTYDFVERTETHLILKTMKEEGVRL